MEEMQNALGKDQMSYIFILPLLLQHTINPHLMGKNRSGAKTLCLHFFGYLHRKPFVTSIIKDTITFTTAC